MWRPKGWKNDSYDCSVCDTEPEGWSGCGSSAYEAGADAMLEAVKKHIDMSDAEAYGSQCCKCLIFWGEGEE